MSRRKIHVGVVQLAAITARIAVGDWADVLPTIWFQKPGRDKPGSAGTQRQGGPGRRSASDGR